MQIRPNWLSGTQTPLLAICGRQCGLTESGQALYVMRDACLMRLLLLASSPPWCSPVGNFLETRSLCLLTPFFVALIRIVDGVHCLLPPLITARRCNSNNAICASRVYIQFRLGCGHADSNRQLLQSHGRAFDVGTQERPRVVR